MPTISFGAQMGKFGIGVYGEGELASSAIIDKNHLKIIVKKEDEDLYFSYDPKLDKYDLSNKEDYEKYSLEYALDNGLTYVEVKGLAIAEVPMGYGYAFNIGDVDYSVGIAIKYMEGITYFNDLSLENSDKNEVENSLTDNQKTSSTFGVDLGFLLKKGSFKIGLVGKDLNSPKFDLYNGNSYKVKPLIRGGVAWDLTDWLTFAADMDISENETFIPGYKSQYVGGGFDIHPGSWISFRAGAMKNLKSDYEGTILTGGIGIGLKWLQVDVSAQVSTNTSTYDGKEIPRYFKVNLALLSRWGG